MLHDLKDSASVYLPYVFFVKMLIQFRVVNFICFVPFQLVLLQPESVCENLFAEGTFVLKVLLLNLVLVAFEVCVLDLIEILD